jgi:hypothetical protein
MDEMTREIASARFDTHKLSAIRRIASGNSVTTQQAMDLAMLCIFDSTRGEALAALFPAVSDPVNYAQTLDLLTFTVTKQRLAAETGLDAKSVPGVF